MESVTMSASLRPSPKYKPASLFVTCMVDMIYPNVGISTVRLLEHVGAEVDFPAGQTCCGQPAFNGGFWDEARQVADNFLKTFADAELIVVPSGSCASMIQHYYPKLYADDPKRYDLAVHLASITWELTEYLVDGLGVTDLGGHLPETRVAFHDACHGLRLSGLKPQSRQLVEAIDGVTVVEMPGADECCGFGGLFAVKMPEVSTAMLRAKLGGLNAVTVDHVLTGDCGCMAQINGGLSRAGKTPSVMHTADFLASAITTQNTERPQ